MSEGASSPPTGLPNIATQWSRISDPSHFFLRYAPAVRQYLVTLLHDPHEADEVTQQLLLQVIERGFANANPDRGRFRDYLIAIVKNAAQNHLRGKARLPISDLPVAEIGVDGVTERTAEREWIQRWHQCLLDRAWRALHAHQRKMPGNQYYAILKLLTDHPDESQANLVDRLNASLSGPVSFEAFRKQLSRARRMFAENIVGEVIRTLNNPTPDEVESELIDLGLLGYIADYLPADWKLTSATIVANITA